MDKWLNFFAPFFEDPKRAKLFVEPLEMLDDPESPQHRAKIMMHQTQRLVSLADDISKIRLGKQSLQLLFIMIGAENMAKLHDKVKKEGRSRKFACKFFRDHLLCEDKPVLVDGFKKMTEAGYSASTMNDVVRIFYDIRCDVVHEGKYWDFHFAENGNPEISGGMIVSMPFSRLRDIVVRGCINATQSAYGGMHPNPVRALNALR